MRKHVSQVLLAVILLLGAAARFWNLNWDQGQFAFYPDEAEYNRDAINLGPDLNPHFFNYGPLPLYLYRATAEVLRAVTGVDWLATTRFALIGRTYSALAATLTIWLVYLAGRRIWGQGAGLLAAAFTASAALAIQNAHFGTVDTDLTLVGVGVLLISLRIAEGGGRRRYLLAGAVLGLGLAVKLPAGSFVVLPLIAHVARVWRRQPGVKTAPGEPAAGRPPARTGRWSGVARVVGSPLLLLGTMIVCCLIAAPYYVLDWPDFSATLATVQAAATQPQAYSFNWQFIGSTPYLFELYNLVVWGLGVPLGMAALAGLVLTLVAAIRTGRVPLLLLAIWPTLYLLYMGTYVGRFIRYLLPLVPFWCLCAAGGLVVLLAWLQRRGQVGAWLGRAVIAGVVVGAAGWGLSYLAVFSRPDTRIAASQWIYANVPHGSHWLMESGFQQLPRPDAQHPPDWFQTSLLPVSSAESPRKAGVFADRLAAADWFEIPDRRASAVLPRLPQFPVARRFYALLFAGQLGYTEVATFASPPQLGPFVWSDDAAEETFQVFDHPTVRIFQNTGHFSADQLRRLLSDPAAP